MITTFTGRRLNPTQFGTVDVHVKDVAHSLAFQCRYGGHASDHYSVAQHSVLLYRYARHVQAQPPRISLMTLLHDAGETYIPDLPRGLKHDPSMHVYRMHSDRAQSVVEEALAFGVVLSDAERAYIHDLDRRIVVDEWAALMFGPYPSSGRLGLGLHVSPWSADVAEDLFLEAYHDMLELVIRVR